jgi:hypothetical protein
VPHAPHHSYMKIISIGVFKAIDTLNGESRYRCVDVHASQASSPFAHFIEFTPRLIRHHCIGDASEHTHMYTMLSFLLFYASSGVMDINAFIGHQFYV